MADPFIFIHNFTIKEGRLEGCWKFLHELVELAEAKEPRLIAFNVYVDDGGGAASAVQVHPDAGSMEFHMQALADKLGEAYEYLDSDSIAIYGTPSDTVLGMMTQLAGSGLPVSIKPDRVAGFTRTQEG